MLALEHRPKGAGFRLVDRGRGGAASQDFILGPSTDRSHIKESHMNGMSDDDDVIANLKAQASRQQQALERIAARCDAVNYPPDLVVDIAVLAKRGLREAAPSGAPREARA
jgi:hypothetical protein